MVSPIFIGRNETKAKNKAKKSCVHSNQIGTVWQVEILLTRFRPESSELRLWRYSIPHPHCHAEAAHPNCHAERRQSFAKRSSTAVEAPLFPQRVFSQIAASELDAYFFSVAAKNAT